MSVAQAAEYLLMTSKRVREYIHSGHIPARRVGYQYRVHETSLLLFKRWIALHDPLRPE